MQRNGINPKQGKKRKRKKKGGGEPRLECDGVACAAKPPEAEEKPLGTIDPATRSMIVWEMLPLTDLCIPFKKEGRSYGIRDNANEKAKTQRNEQIRVVIIVEVTETKSSLRRSKDNLRYRRHRHRQCRRC